MVALNMPADRAKETGSYYTSATVARFLVEWAVRTGTERVIDPSFGGGVFLSAACERIQVLGGLCAGLVYGVELEPDVHGGTSALLKQQYGVPARNLRAGSFFEMGDTLQFDAVVGNPPFIRYQRFAGEARAAALERAAARGVILTELSSSWAPFVVESAARTASSGRLAMVVPSELCHASYAKPVLRYLQANFARIELITFDQRLFPDISQDTMLLLAEDKGAGSGELFWRHLNNAEQLSKLCDGTAPRVLRPRRLNSEQVLSGERRLIEQFIPAKARDLYSSLRCHAGVRLLADVATAGIGYVTGANDFFQLTADESSNLKLPQSALRRSVWRGRALRGLRFTDNDWNAAMNQDAAGFLFHPQPDAQEPSVRRYIARGESLGIHRAYKCRVRNPWFRVPHVHAADALLTYMSGEGPRLLVNETDAVAPNTLHVVRMRPDSPCSVYQLASGWLSSLTMLSAELEGHPMGGGMLKLEPREAARVLVAVTVGSAEQVQLLDRMIRVAPTEDARATIDRMVLKDGLGLQESDCRLLRQAVDTLRERRLHKGATP